MPAKASTIAELRSLLAVRFPEKNRKPTGFVSTGVSGIDAVLGGGLPAGRLTELISVSPGTGGQTIFAELLRTTRSARHRIALIDGADGFDPGELPPDTLRHLVWIRTRVTSEVFAAADILARDGNYAVVVMDLRGLPERTLLKTPSSFWHRLRQAVEHSPTAVLVQTTLPLVPAVPWRLNLSEPILLRQCRSVRADLVNRLRVEVVRGHTEHEAQSA